MFRVNVWPLLLLNLGVPLAAFAEAIFLGLFLWWTGGGGPPRTNKTSKLRAHDDDHTRRSTPDASC